MEYIFVRLRTQPVVHNRSSSYHILFPWDENGGSSIHLIRCRSQLEICCSKETFFIFLMQFLNPFYLQQKFQKFSNSFTKTDSCKFLATQLKICMIPSFGHFDFNINQMKWKSVAQVNLIINIKITCNFLKSHHCRTGLLFIDDSKVRKQKSTDLISATIICFFDGNSKMRSPLSAK